MKIFRSSWKCNDASGYISRHFQSLFIVIFPLNATLVHLTSSHLTLIPHTIKIRPNSIQKYLSQKSATENQIKTSIKIIHIIILITSKSMPLFTIFCHTYVPRNSIIIINKNDDDDFINLTLNCVQQHYNRHHAVCFIFPFYSFLYRG